MVRTWMYAARSCMAVLHMCSHLLNVVPEDETQFVFVNPRCVFTEQ